MDLETLKMTYFWQILTKTLTNYYKEKFKYYFKKL
jgi:hypothetical protein